MGCYQHYFVRVFGPVGLLASTSVARTSNMQSVLRAHEYNNRNLRVWTVRTNTDFVVQIEHTVSDFRIQQTPLWDIERRLYWLVVRRSYLAFHILNLHALVCGAPSKRQYTKVWG